MDVIGKMLAPIVLFVYDRPEHTLKTLNALKKNKLASESILYIIADGPKYNEKTEVLNEIKRTRSICRQKKWCKEVIIEEKKENWGLANSIVRGVSEVISKHGKVIVLEDDLVTQKGFLKYMNDALSLYEDDKKVMHLSGYIYPHDKRTKNETIFLNILSCWGWATWERAWQYYVGDTDLHINRFKSQKQIKKFNIEGHANFYQQLLLNKSGKINSWAVKWYASWLSKGGYSLFPNKSLVINIGHDGTGVHKDNTDLFNKQIIDKIHVEKIDVIESVTVRKSIDKFYKKAQSQYINKTNLKDLSLSFLKKTVRKLLLNPFRSIILKTVPELNHRDTSLKNSIVSHEAKLYSPYSINSTKIDDYTYISKNSKISNSQIGKFCSIGPNLMCGWGIHPTNTISTSPMFYSTQKQNGLTLSNYDKIIETKTITIGHDVFIGMNVTILDGVKIGNGAVIGAGAVVSKDIPSYAIAVGNPIRIIKYRFKEDIIKKLESIQWWDWPLEKLKIVEKEILNAEQFANKHAK